MKKSIVMTLLLSASAFAQTQAQPQARLQLPGQQAQAQKDQAQPSVPVESSQSIWNDDVNRVQGDIDKLKFELSKKQLQERALRALQAGNPGAADKAVQDLMKLDPFSPQASQFSADSEFQKGNWVGSFGQYNLAVANWRDWLKAHKSEAEQEEGRRELSIVYGNRGATRMQMKDWDGALADLEQADKMKSPAQATVLSEEAQLLAVQLHRYADAAKALEKAAALDPTIKDEARKKTADPHILNLCQTLARGGQSTPVCQ